MKILQIIPTLSKAGGAEKFVIDLTVSLKLLGHEVKIIVLYNDSINFFQKEIDEFEIPIEYLNKKRGFDLVNSLLLRRRVLAWKPDVVHTHIRTHLSMKLSGLWNCNNIRFLHTIHSVPDKEAERPILYKIMKPLYMKGKVIPIAISSLLAQQTKEYFKLNYLPKVVYNGIFLDKFIFDDSIEKIYTFVTVARFEPVKNHELIVDAVVGLNRLGISCNLALVGDGVLKNRIIERVNCADASSFVHFLGEVKNVKEILAKSRIFLLPSLYEGNPISILEAMAMKLPIISTKNGGVSDVVTDNVNGFLVDPEDINEVINKMFIMVSDPKTAETMGENNALKVKQFDMLTVAAQYINIYRFS